MTIEAKFYIERDEDSDRLSFGCEINGKRIYFIPNIQITPDVIDVLAVGISSRILYCSPEEISAIRHIYNNHSDLMDAYFAVFVADEWYPLKKSQIDAVASLDLNDDERDKINTFLQRFTYIYLIKDSRTGLVKIGRTDTPETRLKTLIRQDTLMPMPNEFSYLFVWADYPLKEKWLHKEFAEKRIRGEWFALTDEDVQEIKNSHSTEKCWLTGKSLDDEYKESYDQYKAEMQNQSGDDAVN